MEFTGYKAGWDRCSECGQRMVWAKKGKPLRHRSSGVAGTGRKTHDMVVRKREEYSALSLRYFVYRKEVVA